MQSLQRDLTMRGTRHKVLIQMSIPEDKKPTSEMRRRLGRPRSGLRLGRKTVRVLAAVVVLVVVLAVLLILIDHATPADGPHLMP